mgnify:CR=1 FL=1
MNVFIRSGKFLAKEIRGDISIMSAEVSGATSSASQQTIENEVNLPGDTTLQYCAKCALTEDKPVLFDYWSDSLNNSCCIGIREDKEKILVKGTDEYTSPIDRIFKVDDTYIIVTMNSIYVVSANVEVRAVEITDDDE